jgi:putative signal transducing protein
MPFDLAKLVTVETFNAPWEAQLARARLLAEGIEAVIADEHFLRLYSALSSAVGGVKLQVRQQDAERAAEVLRREQPIPEIYLVTEEEPAARPREPEPPECGPLVTVARFHTPWEAHLARTLLESEGIDACVLEERLPPVHLLSGRPLALNRLEVHAEDAGRAAAILAGAAGSREELPAQE